MKVFSEALKEFYVWLTKDFEETFDKVLAEIKKEKINESN